MKKTLENVVSVRFGVMDMTRPTSRNRKPILRIIEVGGGSGGTTKILLPTLENLLIPYKYLMTDVSTTIIAQTE